MEIKIQNIKEFFDGIEFEEKSHTYSVGNSPISISVSGLCKDFVEPFDSEGISLAIANKTGRNQKEILKEWKDKADTACELGTKIHLFGEKYFLDKSLEPNHNMEKAIVGFYNSLPKHVIPVYPELVMYHNEYPFAGTADLILYNTETETFIIADWKTNKDLFKNFKGKTMLREFSNNLDNSFNKYQIQLSFYQILFEQTGYKVSSRKIVWLKPDGKFEVLDTEDYTRILLKYLKDKYNESNALFNKD